MIPQFQREARQRGPRSLLADYRDFGAVLSQICRNRKQQRSGARDDDTLAADRKSGFHHRLQASGTHDIGQSPSRKRQKSFARSGGEDEFSVTKLDGSLIAFGEQCAQRGLIENSRSRENGDASFANAGVP